MSEESEHLTTEEERLIQARMREKNWKRWGPYLSDRQWATVREDYSPDGSSWGYFSHDQARSRAYRWGEDGLLGLTDREGRLCFSFALWNEKDPFLKERLFGLTEKEGNHGEDVKESYFFLDSTPTHSYMKALYKYPHERFPYEELLQENRKRDLFAPEYELADTGIFNKGYFDVFVEYAKSTPDDILIRLTVCNRGDKQARLHLLPTLWFRNTWSWGARYEDCLVKPHLQRLKEGKVDIWHDTLGRFTFGYSPYEDGSWPKLLVTENNTNTKKLFGSENVSPYVKDAFHSYVVDGKKDAVNPRCIGSKCAPHYVFDLAPGEQKQVLLRLSALAEFPKVPFDSSFNEIFNQRLKEADEFYGKKIPARLSDDEKNIMRQAYAGLLWTKQFYYYVVSEWLDGDPAQPPPPPQRKAFARNKDWVHFFARDIISMPDKWEYPWFAAWDLAFHMIPFAKIDPDFAKAQMLLFLREWYMHPNGQQPAYEFSFSDVNPPVHAWAAWRIYKMTGKKGERDIVFLESVFQKLLLNFTWWVNRKDLEGNHLFAGGFLGLDNIGVFNRSMGLPTGGALQQADGTAWMAFYCLTMLNISLELAFNNPVYEDLASKFFEHFVRITDAINQFGGSGLWDDQDGFYYDQLRIDGSKIPLRLRSLVGLIPMIAVEILEERHLSKLKGFTKRMEWFLKHRQDLEDLITYCEMNVKRGHRMLAIPSKERLTSLLKYMLDEKEFLSSFGIRSLSKTYQDHPFLFQIGGQEFRVDYSPGESTSRLYGGNSNWRGPIWFPLNFLIIEALERYHHFYGDSFKVECPVGSGKMLNLSQVSQELMRRLCTLFLPDAQGNRPCHGGDPLFRNDPYWQKLLLFHEYFHAESGKGLGANHQTGWTAIVAKLMEDLSKY